MPSNDRLDDLLHDAGPERFVDERARRNGAMPPVFGPRSSQRSVVICAVRSVHVGASLIREERHSGPVRHSSTTRRSPTTPIALAHRRRGGFRVARSSARHAFAGGKAVGFENDRRSELAGPQTRALRPQLARANRRSAPGGRMNAFANACSSRVRSSRARPNTNRPAQRTDSRCQLAEAPGRRRSDRSLRDRRVSAARQYPRRRRSTSERFAKCPGFQARTALRSRQTLSVKRAKARARALHPIRELACSE